LEQAGFTPLLFSELNDSAADTYSANRPELNVPRIADVYRLKNSDIDALRQKWCQRGIRDIDLVCGGPPCQGYSGIGHRRTFKVQRNEIPSNHLYKEMIRVVAKVKPKVFLFENVRGLLSGRWTVNGQKGEIWRDVREAFGNVTGYYTEHALLQAKSYGVPQNRPRIIIIGVRHDLGWNLASEELPAGGLLPAGEHSAPDLETLLGDLIDPEYLSKSSTSQYLRDPENHVQEQLRLLRGRKLLRKGDVLTEQEYSQHSVKIRRKFQYMLEHDGEIPTSMQTKKFAQRVLPRKWGAQGPNITACALADDFVHYSQARVPTVREWARLQTFPDWYIFKGPRTTGGRRRAGDPSEGIWDREVPKYTQIGNAVPVRLAEEIGKHLSAMLN
jgi:DNA (cytosine-5)-methyltransferase 1